MLKNYFKIAWRNLLKYKFSSLINIFGLTLGITTCLILLIFIDYESNFDSEHTMSESAFRVVQHQKFPEETFYYNTTPYPLANALREDFSQFKVVTQIVGLMTHTIGIENNNNTRTLFEESNILYVDAFYNKVFDNVKWLAGNNETVLKSFNEVILTETIANKYFEISDSDYSSIIDKQIFIDNETPLLVKGVVSKSINSSNYQFDILLPYQLFEKNKPNFAANWSGNHQGATFVILNDVSQKALIEAELEKWKTKYLPQNQVEKVTYKLQPLKEIHTNSLYGGSPGGYIMSSKNLNIAFLVALFILGIAIVNFINLITAQSSVRLKEIGVLKVLGSRKSDLVLRFILENSILIIISALASIAIVHVVLDIVNNALPIIRLNLQLEWNHLYLIIGIIVTTIIFASIYPALVLSSFHPIQALKGKLKISNLKNLTTRKSLIVFQFIIVQIFIVAVVVIGYQMRFFNTQDVGFSAESVIITPSPEFNKMDVFKNRLLSENGITEVSFGSGPPMGIDDLSLGTSFRLPEQTAEEGKYSEIKIGDQSYIDFYELELIAGESFRSTSNIFNQFVVNETLIKTYGWLPEEAIGKQLVTNEGKATIVGVVKDYHNNALQYEITPSIILNWNSFQMNAFIKIKGNDVATISNIKTIWEDTFKSSVYNFSFLNDAIEREYVVERLVFNTFSILSVLAICIGCLGLFGLMAFILMTKSKEIAIRKVLGSGIAQIVSFLTKEFITLIIIASIIATPIAYYFVKSWLQDFSYRIDLSFWLFIAGGCITLGIALITCSYHSLRAAFSNPVNSLRSE